MGVHPVQDSMEVTPKQHTPSKSRQAKEHKANNDELQDIKYAVDNHFCLTQELGHPVLQN